jgi:hypothetical protein
MPKKTANNFSQIGNFNTFFRGGFYHDLIKTTPCLIKRDKNFFPKKKLDN